MYLGDGNPEVGNNVGTNFLIQSYADNGALLHNILAISRQTGETTVWKEFTIAVGGSLNVLHGNLANWASAAKIAFAGGGTEYGISMRPQVDNTNAIMFNNSGNTGIGSIGVTATGVAFNVSSAAELKEDLKAFDAGAIIDATKVYDFKWKSTEERAYGVIAQQAVDVYPQAVTHSEMEGGEFWGVDYSKYVPVILQELQALRKRVAELEAQIAQPKGA
jgi:hypothetical protein